MKKVIVSLSAAALLVACGAEKEDKKKDEGKDQKAQTEEKNNKTTTKVKPSDNTNGTHKEESAVDATTISFDRTKHDFGDITEGEKVKTVFKFTNDGDAPLVIQSAKGSCGCTVPSYPKSPVAPGEDGEIEVVFDSKNKGGKINKFVTLTANTDPKVTKLSITGNVKK